MVKRGVKRAQRKESSKGLSTIVATLLIILLTLVAVGIIWIVIKNVISNGSEQASLGKFTLNLEIKSISRDSNTNSMNVKIKRNTGEGEISGLAFIAYNGDGTEIVKIENVSLNQLEEKTFEIDLSDLNVTNLEKVSIAPIFTLESGKQITGDIADTYVFSGSSGMNITCTDTCASLGYQCETQSVCGVDINCGTCSTGYSCSSGQCILATPIGACTTLSNAGTTYTLTSNVTSTGTCFTISAQNITLDCNNNWITYSTGGATFTYGIATDQFNTTIENCKVLDGNWATSGTGRFGIYFNGNDNSTLLNNFVNASNSFGIYLYNGANFNKLINNIGKSATYNFGIYLFSSSNNILTENTGTSDSAYGIYLESSNNNILTSNTGISNWGAGIFIYSSSNNNVLTNNVGKCSDDASINNICLGISIISSSNNRLTKNIGKGNYWYGIVMESSSNNILINNNATSHGDIGIDIRLSSNNILINNTGTSDYNSGISLSYTSINNSLTSNIGTSFWGSQGITLHHDASNNILTNNVGVGNDQSGIFIYSGSNNNILTNNTAISNTNYGIFVSESSNNVLVNNIGTSNSRTGIWLAAAQNNTLINNRGTSNASSGIYLQSSSNNILTNNTGTSNLNQGIYLSYSSNNVLVNNTGTSNIGVATIITFSSNNTLIGHTARTLEKTGSFNYGIYIWASNDTIFRDCVNISGVTKDVYYTNTAGSVNNTFINCPYTSEIVSGAGNQLIRKWYYRTYVNSSSGAIQGASVSAFNNLNAQQFTGLTDSSGWIGRQEVIDYINTGGTKLYYNNYIINASKTGYTTQTKSYNFTIQQSKVNDFFTI